MEDLEVMIASLTKNNKVKKQTKLKKLVIKSKIFRKIKKILNKSV